MARRLMWEMFWESYNNDPERRFATLVYQTENSSQYVRTTKKGTRIFKSRTQRGMRQHTRIWARKYPKLFSREALHEIRGGQPA